MYQYLSYGLNGTAWMCAKWAPSYKKDWIYLKNDVFVLFNHNFINPTVDLFGRSGAWAQNE